MSLSRASPPQPISKANAFKPVGVGALQRFTDRAPEAITSEPAPPTMAQIGTEAFPSLFGEDEFVFGHLVGGRVMCWVSRFGGGIGTASA